MIKLLNSLLGQSSQFLSRRKGLLPSLGLMMILTNYILQLFYANTWVTTSNLFLHLGLIVALVGIIVAWAL